MRLWLPKVVIALWSILALTIYLLGYAALHVDGLILRTMFSVLLFLLLSLILKDLCQKTKPSFRLFPIIGRLLELFSWRFIKQPYNHQLVYIIDSFASGTKPIVSFGHDSLSPIKGLRPSIFPLQKSIINRVTIGNAGYTYSSNRLNFSALGYGPVNSKMVESLGKAASDLDCFQNTGEDGLSKYHRIDGQPLCLQLGTGYLGFTDLDGNIDFGGLEQACIDNNICLIEIKISQGGKPGLGGFLPGTKVDSKTATEWKKPIGEDIITPPRHIGVNNAEDLLLRIAKIRSISKVPVGIKICWGYKEEFENLIDLGEEMGILPDFITLDSSSGGSGAANIEHMIYVGTPLELAITEANAILISKNLRDRIKIIASGKVSDGFSFIRTIALGADICNMTRAPMIAAGCIQARRCHTGNCPSGIATTSKVLKSAFNVKIASERIKGLHSGITSNAEQLLSASGVSHISDLSEENFLNT